MLIALAKIPESKGKISPSSFYEHLPDYYSHMLALHLIYLVDEFFFLFQV